MKFIDIDKKLTEKVIEYIAQGYTIHSPSMPGHQGEINKVDLVKGKELLRVWLVSDHDWNDPNGLYNDKILLRVGRWNKEVNTNSRNPYINETVWFRDITVIEETVFYKIGRYDNWYTDDKDVAIHAARINSARTKPWRYGTTYTKLQGDKYKEVAAKYLRRVAHYQRLSMDNIVVSKSDKGNTYHISYNGKNYYLRGTEVEKY